MPHMLAQEHQAIVDCIRYGVARTQATIAAALAAIGATPTLLSLTFTGDGIWTVTSNLTIPSNVTLHIPPGVTVNRASGVTLTIQGVVWAASNSWESGPGSTVRNLSALTEISGIAAGQFISTAPTAGAGIAVQSSSAAGARRVRIFTDQGSGCPGISLALVDNDAQQTYQMYANTAGNLTWARPAAAWTMCLTSTSLGLGPNFSPSATFYLQLSGDFAAKPNGGSWTNPVSSRAFKDIHDDFTDGLDVLKKLQPVRFHYNGMGGMPTDQEFIGLVAEDVEDAAPYMLRTSRLRVHEDDADETDVLGLNDGDLRFILRNAIMELDKRLAALEGRTGETEESVPTPARSRPRRTKE
jgi:Chaperone of endosialidase